MKKQYLFCCALLLSAPSAQYVCAMQGQHNQLNQPVDRNWINQIVNEIQPRQQPTPEEVALFNQVVSSLNQQAQPIQPVQGANQGQPAQYFELTRAGRRMINQIGRDLSTALPGFEPQQVQARNQVQPGQRAEQRRVLTPAEQTLVNQIVDNLESYPNFVQCLHDAGLLEQFLGQAQEQEMPVAAQLVAQEAQQVARPAREEQPILTPIEYELIAQLEQELAPLGNNAINDVLLQAYINPHVLVQNRALEDVLSERQKEFVNNLLEMYAQRINQQN